MDEFLNNVVEIVRTRSAPFVDRWLTEQPCAREGLAKNDVAISAAVLLDNPQLTEILIKHGACANGAHPDGFGDAPLAYAARVGSSAAGAVLVRNGATDPQGFALFNAVREQHSKFVRLLLDAGVKPASSHVFAATKGSCEIFSMLFQAGGDTMVRSKSLTPLMLAAFLQNVDVVTFLIEHSTAADLNAVADSPNYPHVSAFAACVPFLARGRIKQMLRMGAVVSHEAVLSAAQRPDSGVLQVLLEAAGDDCELTAALCVAVDTDKYELALLLLAYGAEWPTKERPSVAMRMMMVSHDAATIARERVKLFKQSAAVDVLIALQDLDLPAWISVCILQQTSPLLALTPLHVLWAAVTKIKHWRT